MVEGVTVDCLVRLSKIRCGLEMRFENKVFFAGRNGPYPDYDTFVHRSRPLIMALI